MKRSIIAGLVLAGLLAGGAAVSASASASAQDAGRSTVADTSWGGWVCPPNATTDICGGQHRFPHPPGAAVELDRTAGSGRPIGTTDTSWGG
ncbi:hypothetical protein [Streptomyces sp. NRRL WC-3742]|uniref:hypothetical protein n=1 Tax=Streptomyces sp. NRRL WC-3742 TaxID=1463934 RepID=UPI0004C70440|nr:hypothetical protein [Streptomyces sp. NRRL WC-3742]